MKTPIFWLISGTRDPSLATYVIYIKKWEQNWRSRLLCRWQRLLAASTERPSLHDCGINFQPPLFFWTVWDSGHSFWTILLWLQAKEMPFHRKLFSWLEDFLSSRVKTEQKKIHAPLCHSWSSKIQKKCNSEECKKTDYLKKCLKLLCIQFFF